MATDPPNHSLIAVLQPQQPPPVPVTARVHWSRYGPDAEPTTGRPRLPMEERARREAERRKKYRDLYHAQRTPQIQP